MKNFYPLNKNLMADIRKLLGALRGKEEKHIEREPKIHEDRVAAYTLLKEKFHPKADVVYHPCGEMDISPSRAFPESRVIYVDVNGEAMKALSDKKYEAHQASALEFVPDVPVDILILINPTILPEKPVKTLANEGYAFCNNYHGTATDIHASHREFTFLGVVHYDQQEQKQYFDDANLEDYWEEVQTETEFKNATPGSKGVSYEAAAQIVKHFTGKEEEILLEYKKLLAKIKQENKDKRNKDLAALQEKFPDVDLDIPEEEDQDIRMYQGFLFDYRLPKKKGGSDDIYVFKKTAVED